MEFEWDASKAEANFRRHGVAFEDAIAVFDDDMRSEWWDHRDDYREDRYCTIGVAKQRLLLVVYTMRGDDRIRIIGARAATRTEKDEHRGNR